MDIFQPCIIMNVYAEEYECVALGYRVDII